jgi:hypothetical protein
MDFFNGLQFIPDKKRYTYTCRWLQSGLLQCQLDILSFRVGKVR